MAKEPFPQIGSEEEQKKEQHEVVVPHLTPDQRQDILGSLPERDEIDIRFASELAEQVDPALHRALFYDLLDFGEYRFLAVAGIPHFSGLDAKEAFDACLAHGLARWMGDEEIKHPDFPLMKWVDVSIADDDVTYIQILSSRIPEEYHNQIALKIVRAGYSLFTLFDDYYGADFLNLDNDVFFASMQDEAIEKRRAMYTVDKESIIEENLSTYLRFHDRFEAMDNTVLDVFSRYNKLNYIDLKSNIFFGPLSRKNAFAILKNKPLSANVGFIADRATKENAGSDSDGYTLDEILDFLWDEVESGENYVLHHLGKFYRILSDERFGALVRKDYRQVRDLFLLVGRHVQEDEVDAFVDRMFTIGLGDVVLRSKRCMQVLSDKEVYTRLTQNENYHLLLHVMGKSLDGVQGGMSPEFRFHGLVGRDGYEKYLEVEDLYGLSQDIIDAGEDELLMRYLPKFEVKNAHEEEIEDNGGDTETVFEKHKSYVDHNALVERLLDAFDEETQGLSLVERQNIFLDSVLVKFYQHLDGIDLDLVKKIMRYGAGNVVMKRDFQFYFGLGEEKTISAELSQEIYQILFETNQLDVVAEYIQFFDESIDRNKVARVLLDHENNLAGRSLMHHLKLFTGLDMGIVLELLERFPDKLLFLLNCEDSFEGGFTQEMIISFIDILIGHGLVSDALSLNEKYGRPNTLLDQLYQMCGAYLSKDIYEVANQISEISDIGEIDDEVVLQRLARYGVDKGGADGVEQFMQYLWTLRHKIIGGMIERDDLHDEIGQAWFARVVRYDTSQWGKHSRDSMMSLVKDYFRLSEAGELESMPAGYEASHPLAILQKGEVSDQFKYTEGFLSKWQSLLEEIRLAESAFTFDTTKPPEKRNKSLNKIVEEMRTVRAGVLDTLYEQKQQLFAREDLSQDALSTALFHLQQRIENLEEVDLENISQPEKLFVALRGYPEFSSLLRSILFYMTFVQHEGVRSLDAFALDSEQPSIDDISAVEDFIQHMTHQETIAPLFKSKKAKKLLKKLLNTNALKEEFERMMQKREGGLGVKPIRITPQRNILTEMSGHIGDACWANHYASILKEFPDFVSYTYTLHPDDVARERLVGSGFLIECESEQDEPLLVIRGNNPIENFINGVDPWDFMEQTIGYFEQIATNRERRLAMVIDYAGGAGTNRHALQKVYETLKPGLDKTLLKSNVGTQFNGYDIRNKVFRVSLEEVRSIRARLG